MLLSSCTELEGKLHKGPSSGGKAGAVLSAYLPQINVLFEKLGFPLSVTACHLLR